MDENPSLNAVVEFEIFEHLVQSNLATPDGFENIFFKVVIYS